MFTGIIHHVAEIISIKPLKISKERQGGLTVTVTIKPALKNYKLGESIALDGCCLTLTSYAKGKATFDLSDETLKKTNFSGKKVGDKLHVERALAVGERLGGHFVLGHVDTTGDVLGIYDEKGSWRIDIKVPKKYGTLLIEKGSVTINGVSLTVCDLKRNRFSLFLIPHTVTLTQLLQLKVSDKVNVEFDVLGKYILRASEVVK